MNIGLIAHDSKKKLMQNFCIAYKGILNKNQLFATGTTGRLIEEVTNLSVHKFLAGHLGGDQQLCAQIEHNQDMVNRGEMMSIDDVNDILQLNVIGAVPDDENIVVATNKGQPLVGDDSLAGQAYMNICRRITGEEIPFLDLNGKGGFFKKLSAFFKSDKKN